MITTERNNYGNQIKIRNECLLLACHKNIGLRDSLCMVNLSLHIMWFA